MADGLSSEWSSSDWWRGDASSAAALISRVAASLPGGGAARSDALQALERSGCLERLLWPAWRRGGAAAAAPEHALLVVLAVGQKSCEGLPAWEWVHAAAPAGADAGAAPEAAFQRLWLRVLRLRASAAAAPGASAAVLAFLSLAWASLECPAVRAAALPCAALPLWLSVSPARVEAELFARPALARPWARLLTDYAADARWLAEHPGADTGDDARAARLAAAAFLPSLVAEALEAVESR
jgi:hypothetical protein